MSTKRKQSKSTESKGIRYVKSVVENDNSIFQLIEPNNDQGNDAYIEFILDEEATGSFVWVQIKSGKSYKKKDYYLLPADKDHFEYWGTNVAPVVGIVYDPELDTAFWLNITEYLHNNPTVRENGPYTLHINPSKEFSETTFSDFKRVLLAYVSKYENNENFGRALEYFSMVENPRRCLEGLITLFVNYRNRKSTWFYLINCFSSIDNKLLLSRLIERLSLLSGHMDIFWHKDNMIEREVEDYAKSVIAKCFGKKEIIKLLEMVDDAGFSRGSFGYSIYTIIGLITNQKDLLKGIAFDSSFQEDLRSTALFLFVHFGQFSSPENCIKTISDYFTIYPDAEDADLFLSMKTQLETEGFLGYVG